MNADEFMKKHIDIQKIDSDESIRKNIVNIFKIINSTSKKDLNEGKRKTELTKIRNILKIDLILLKSSQSYKEYKIWEKKIVQFEKDLN